MEFDHVLLSRIQFGFTVTFHIIFPAFTIGLSAFIAVLLARWAYTDDPRFRDLARFWIKIFAVSFAMGVVSGLVLSYEIGTNWSHFSKAVGNVIGPLLAYEVLTAFFLEATFLGILLFGHNRVPRWLHVTSAIMVAIGTATSAFWILSANSWMQYPTGYEVRDGIAYPMHWGKIVLNPTFPLRFAHMVTAAYLTTAIVVLAVGARFALAGVFPQHARTMLRMGLGLALILVPLQIFIGDQHGLDTAEYQPAKLAAIEAHWDGAKPAPFVFFAWPDLQAEMNRFAIAIPHVGSLLITHEWDGTFQGLKDFTPQDRPPVAPVFFAFRIMVGIGFLLLGLVLWGAIVWLKGELATNRAFLRVAAISWPVGFIAIIAGWIVTEVGRQPWVATGLFRTADAASPLTTAPVAGSLGLFVLVYGIVFSTGIYAINRLINKGPTPEVLEEEGGLPSRPLSAVSGGVATSAGEE
jgi:cytochrome d ubiquinol oxidase subunit I